MADRTGIEWTDATWNPVTGCTKVSEGCDHCYAETIAHRFTGTKAYPNGFGVTLRPERLDQPLRWKRPRKVFVNSMSDLFHKDVPDDYIARVFAVMARAPQHTFQVLTKRPGRMRSLLNSPTFMQDVWRAFQRPNLGPLDEIERMPWPLPNVWLGTSVENQKWADVRIPLLMETPAAIRFLSCEPLLGHIKLTHLHSYCPTHDFPGGFCVGRCRDRRLPDWVIVGGESGPGARPMDPRWARHLRDDCTNAGIAFHFKQWGEWGLQGDSTRKCFIWPDGSTQDARGLYSSPITGALIPTEIPTRPGWIHMVRCGKRTAGRELDGQTWDEYPNGGE